RVLDSDAAEADRVRARHAAVKIAAPPPEVPAAPESVIPMLRSGEYVRAVALGPDGLAEGFEPESLLIDTSSSEPAITAATAEALRERGINTVDATVSGSEWGARRAELVFMVGGHPACMDRAPQ